MRHLLLAGAVLAAFSTSAQAWTQSLLHPESREAAIVTTMPAPPRYTGYDDLGLRAAPIRAPRATARPFEPSRPSDPPAWRSCPWC
ncbi:hypothetical protein NS228_07880 [Methylobacterium indicum]|uniref:Uncharacterized protein n=1 Tax=Methylobacterium indicum TaxID=1775910 RepID=A0ABR5GN65_9HYPH|nr:hypothetical protein [Methylobacterium indicum]KMO10139.1 hypothetical protein QR79_31370 [Methylobacterium indicum]KMO24465.1 hypothetical protein QR78_00580 [Methylobacterium indicum]KTS32783.1 hypothetical protein NS229_12345 [Methylobacterium indicum]KTS41141.1 hypothetical protein NS228_07880 [Methylobacterium indicum]KTS53042.1 hypothetical protein NS230_07965 [Methylobacterium indicum]